MSSADFLTLVCCYRYQHSPVGTSIKISRDKVLSFRRVLPDLLCAVTVEFWACAIHCSLSLRCSALYQISVRQNAYFADGFLQISPCGKHPCHSLTLPINPACAGTFTLQVKELCPTYNNLPSPSGEGLGVRCLWHLQEMCKG
jgi:hypothetical protein